MDDYHNPASIFYHDSSTSSSDYLFCKPSCMCIFCSQESSERQAREEEQKTIIKYVAVTEEELARIEKEKVEEERLEELARTKEIEERKAMMAEDLRIYQEAKRNRKAKWRSYFAGELSITELYPQLNSYNLRAGVALGLVGGLLYFL